MKGEWGRGAEVGCGFGMLVAEELCMLRRVLEVTCSTFARIDREELSGGLFSRENRRRFMDSKTDTQKSRASSTEWRNQCKFLDSSTALVAYAISCCISHRGCEQVLLHILTSCSAVFLNHFSFFGISRRISIEHAIYRI